MPLQPLEVNSLWTMEQQVYIGSSHCPIDGWYQACRVCNLWTAAELDVAGKVIPLCKGCQTKCHNACAKAGAAGGSTIAATSSALLALDQAWEDYLNKIRADNNMALR
ncbi:g12559 [Coccomyxa viridis]|uniref:G12559 protein n=1 Tax=Coccomyxa viridis TaxID=1274662 RepID=A0ABP1GG55_9CHLO